MLNWLQRGLLALALCVLALSAALPEDDAAWQQRSRTMRRHGRAQTPCLREDIVPQGFDGALQAHSAATPVFYEPQLSWTILRCAPERLAGSGRPFAACSGRAPPAGI